MIQSFFAPIHKDGWKFIGAFALGALILWSMSTFIGCLAFVLTAWCAYFFRDPTRVTPSRSGLIIAPADGIVQAITQAPLPKELEGGGALYTRVSIFLNVFDVHINRVPLDGTIQKIIYNKGLFFNASLDKASEHNERQTVVVKDDSGLEITFVQIAGLIARRIRCDITEGQTVKAGERYGLIRFGSRMDIYLPEDIAPLVSVGQRMIGGETVMADLNSKEPAREGVIR
ncbi:MAG: phosphatidylserine decarboxylase [Alphaproteobacteria bacterium 43-37]|nr:MAG: phosphatidylserine decarboxylase [Alphaproteobacteria bacterium 43-37]